MTGMLAGVPAVAPACPPAYRSRRSWLVAFVCFTSVFVSGCTASRAIPPPVALCQTTGLTASAAHPNIVFLLTDDLSSDLVQFMPHVRALEKAGTTFTNYTVTDSLCCPSRASIFSGKFPHDTGVFTNGGPDGGFATFHNRGEEATTFATALQHSGYRTAMMGKYLNNYIPTNTLGGTKPYVPPGWSEWDVAGGGYKEFNYNLNQNHVVVHYGKHPADYLTDVLARRAVSFTSHCSGAHQPFFLEVATFAPHRPFVPAPRDAQRFAGLRAPRTASYDRLPLHAPRWLRPYPPLTTAEMSHIDYVFRRRAQSVLAVDDALARIESTLRRLGDSGNTDIFFSSDNGFHLGQHRLEPGKMTAYDTDVRVPLIAAGPGIAAGRRCADVVENIDLAPTFEALAGLSPGPQMDGRSLVPLLRGGRPAHWRTAALVEHHGPDTSRTAGPDIEEQLSGNPPTYNAIRTPTYVYVEYVDGSRELYDLVRDPDETDNLAPHLDRTTARLLHESLVRLTTCTGASACWRAGHALLPGPLHLVA